MIVIRELARISGNCQLCEPETARYKYIYIVRSSQDTNEMRICGTCVRDLNKIVRKLERGINEIDFN